MNVIMSTFGRMLAFGFAAAFALLGWPAIRDLGLGAGWLSKLLFVTGIQ